MKTHTLLFIFLFGLLTTNVMADFMDLKDFYQNPDDLYFRPVPKSHQSSKHITEKLKLNFRERLNSRVTKSEPGRNDRVQSLFPYDKIEKNLELLDKMELKQAQLPHHPWSDDYWPIYKGVLANRYGDPENQNLDGWKMGYDYFQNNQYSSDWASPLRQTLSPAEKYDLLLGNQFNLTKKMWSQGERYYRRNGEVERWMGICHGWAPASFKVDRPKAAINVPAHDGKTLTFYPADIKALASLLWAEAPYNSYFIGSRCNAKDPSRDSQGRVNDIKCRDNNSSTFFLAVLHGLGIKQESFVMDATYDYQVWNQPLYSYRYDYFNVKDEEETTNLKDAIVPINEFKKDPFKKFRSQKAKYIVGIQMVVTYGVETSPSQRTFDNEDYDQNNSAYYTFDLELDSNLNIVGGEWYHDHHPDFLWRPVEGSEAQTSEDFYLLSEPLWKGEHPLNSNIQSLGQAATREASPLSYLVKSLVRLSSQQGEI